MGCKAKGGNDVGCFSNLLWFLTGGIVIGLAWVIVGCLWCVTIIGIPVGLQCFKFASLSFFPFGKNIVYDDSTVSLLLNILWILFSGIELAMVHVVCGLMLCITIIGIPFGMQHFKLAKLALLPFGTSITNGV